MLTLLNKYLSNKFPIIPSFRKYTVHIDASIIGLGLFMDYIYGTSYGPLEIERAKKIPIEQISPVKKNDLQAAKNKGRKIDLDVFYQKHPQLHRYISDFDIANSNVRNLLDSYLYGNDNIISRREITELHQRLDKANESKKKALGYISKKDCADYEANGGSFDNLLADRHTNLHNLIDDFESGICWGNALEQSLSNSFCKEVKVEKTPIYRPLTHILSKIPYLGRLF